LAKARRSGGGRVSKRAKHQLARLRHAITRQLQRDKQANAERVAAQLQADYEANNLHSFYATISRLGVDGPSQRAHTPLRGHNGEMRHTSQQ
jgi:hypothetical protein